MPYGVAFHKMNPLAFDRPAYNHCGFVAVMRRQCIQGVYERLHVMGVPRIHTDIKLGTRSDRDQRMADKVASVQQKLL